MSGRKARSGLQFLLGVRRAHSELWHSPPAFSVYVVTTVRLLNPTLILTLLGYTDQLARGN